MKSVIRKFTVLWVLVLLSLGLSAQVNAEFATSTTSGCSPLVVMFTDQSTGGPTSWRWDFGNGNGSIQRNPSAIYMTPGTYTVRLIATGPSGIDTVIKTQLITVFRDPQARFAANRLSACIPATINFTDQSLPGDGALNYWLWDFGDGSTSTQQNPTHTYTNPGTYSVTLLVRDANGCRNEFTRTNYITIMPNVTAGFTGTPTSGCNIPHTVNFTNTTIGGSGFTYLWNFGDGTTSTQTNPSHTYTTGGTYTVTLTATNSAGCSNTRTRTNYVTINNIVANFSVNRTTPCVGQNVTYTSNSPGAVWWSWNFGDGSTSNDQTPIRSYSNAGTYTVTLIVRNASGCRDTIVMPNLITVRPRPTTNFTATPLAGCSVPFTVQFTNTTANGVSYAWDFGDGGTSTATNPSHTYTSAGTYTVRLVATGANGCTHTRTRYDYITVQIPNVAFTANVREGCIPLTVNFTDQSTANNAITGWLWNFGDGSTSTQRHPTHTYTTVGRFNVTLTITTASGCSRSVTYPQYIRAGQQPTIEFTATPRQTCLFFPVSFTDQSTPADFWFWQFGDGGTSFDQNPVYQYGDTGLFTVTLIVGVNGCYDTLVKPNYIRIFPPRASFNTLYNCADPYTVGFTNTSLGGHVWLWKFGDGTTGTTRHASHTYATRGDYTVTLTVWDTIGGCLDSTQALIQVREPVAAFTANDTVGCVNLPVTFTHTSTDAFSFAWDFGNGQTSTSPNPSVLYMTPGVYTVRLIVRDIHNCADTFIRPNYITALGAFANFNADTLTGCTPLVVDYQDLSTSFMGNVVAWNWDLGAGQTSNLQHPSGYYNVPGNYTITLTVTDDNTCSSTLSRVNFIQPTYPTPAFSSNDTLVCLGAPVNFINTSVGSGMTYGWDFGDGSTSTATNPTHTFADTGRYTITLHVTDINGCDSTTVRNQYIHVVQPTPLFMADTLDANCPPLLVNFSNLSSPDVTGWIYDFGDGQTSNLANPSHIYVNPGVYYPTLTITNNIGCTATYNLPDSIVVRGPTGSFIYNQITFCAPFEVEFYAQGTNPAVTHIWDFGDGNVNVDDDTATHYYAIPGTFNPQLILDDQMGCVIALPTISPIFAAIVDADFVSDVTYMCRPGDAHFTDLSSGVPGIVAWHWDFGDGSTSTAQNPTHYYAATGSYDVTLIATNAAGCHDTLYRPSYIRVMDDPTALFTVNTQNACFPANITFTNQSTADTTIASILWVFDDGTTSTQQNPSRTYASPGTYNVQLMITTVMGCKDTFEMPITLYVPPAAAAGLDIAICIGASDVLSGSGGVSYQWSPATGLSATNIATPTANPTGTADYVLLVTDGNGCQDTDTVRVTVNPLPTPNATAGNICISGSAALNAMGGVGYAWSPAATLNAANISNPSATPTVTTMYTVTVTDANGCINTAQATVNVSPLPTVTTSPDAAICIGFSSQLNATGGVGYAWSPAASLSAANIANPTATPTATTTYTVTVTDANGCVNTGSTTITVNPLPTVVTSPPAAICIGQSSQLNATGGVSYAWNNAGSLDAANISNPTATPTATTTYTVTVTDANGCINTGTTTITVNPLPTVTTSPNAAICIGQSSPLNATGGVSYAWSPAGTLSAANIANPTATPTATTTYTVTVTDANGCVNTGSTTITVNLLPTVTTSPEVAICIGFSSQLNATGGVGYAWSPAASLSAANIANPTATPTVTTTYTVTVTDANGCINTGSTTITVNPLPTVVTSPPTAICIGQSSQLNATGGVSYAWNNVGSLDNANVSNPTATPTVTTTYTVTVTDANGCVNTGSTTITVNPLPTVTTSPNAAICIGQSSPLNATGGVSYAWSPAATLSAANIANPVATPTATTTYTVTVTDANGCLNTGSTTITVNPLPTVTTSPPAAICIGFSSQLNATGGVGYAWSPAASLSAANIANPTATPTVTTTYTVTVTDANGCINTGSTTITVNPLPTVVTSPPVAICIGQSSPLNATGGVSYAWNNAGSLNAATISNPTATPTATTTYTVTVTDANGCINTGSTTITVNPLPTVTTSPNAAICIGQSSPLNATGGVSYAWSPAGTLSAANIANPTATPTATTTYTVTVTDINGCVNTGSTTITVNPLPTVVTSPDVTICIGFSSQLNATGGVSYAWSPAATLSAANIANPTATPTVTTTYTVTVTDANGCVNTGSTTITVNPLPTVVTSPPAAICIGQSSQLNATGGVSYVWNNAGSLDAASISNPTATPTVTTTYTVTVTDANGCINTGTTTITVNPLPIVGIHPDTLLCLGQRVQLFANGGAGYMWGPSAGLNCLNCPIPLATPITNTTYTVTVTSLQGCIDSAKVRVNLNTVDARFSTSDTTACVPTTMQFNDLSVADSTIVAWNWAFGDGSTSTAQNPSHTYTASGIYTARLQVTTSTGCVDSTTLVLNINALPAAAAGPDRTICINDTTTLQGSGGVSYAWSPAGSLSNANIAAPQAFPLSTTTYTLTVTDANGCQGTGQVTVRVNPLPVITITPGHGICEGDSTQLIATGGIDYLWSPATGLNCTTCDTVMGAPSLTRLYTVLVTDTNGCKNSATSNVVVNVRPQIQLSLDTAICIGDTAYLMGGFAGQYLWQPTASLDCATCAFVKATPDTTTTYTFTVTGSNGCPRSRNVTVTVNPLPTVVTTPDTAICHGQSIELTVSGGANYQWTPSQSIACGATCDTIMATPDSTTSYSILVTDLNGCQSRGDIDVTVYQLEAAFTLTDSSACTPQTITLTDQSRGDNPIASWLWNLVDGGLANTPNTTVNYATPGTRDIWLLVTDNKGCIDTATQSINLLASPVAFAGPDTAICFGETAQLLGLGGDMYLWSGDATISDPTIANPIVSPSVTTTYYLNAGFNNGCENWDTIVVTVNALPMPSIDGDTVACFGDSLRFTATGGTEYLWTPSQGLTSAVLPNTTAYAEQDITYTVLVTNASGCTATDSIVLKVNPVPAITVSPNVEICLGESTQLEATGALVYAWGPGESLSCIDCAAPMANPTESTTYMIVGFNEFDCSTVDTVRVTVRPVPTVATIADETLCNGETLELTTTATGATGFAWTANGQAMDSIQSPAVNPTETTLYIVEAYNQYGCTDHDTVSLRVIATILTAASDDAVICEGQNVNMNIHVLETGLSDYEITWLPEDLFHNPHHLSQTFFPEESMTVYIAINGGDCAADTQAINITVNNLPETDLGPNRTVLMGEYVTLDANASAGVTEYYWAPNDSLDCSNCDRANFNAWGSNAYTVTVTDENGCTAIDTVQIRVLTTCEQDIFIPNSFSPNNDQANDVLYIRSHQVHEIKIFRIFDRWGNLVFETSDIAQGWNGTYNNLMVDPGVFVYYLEGTCPNGGEILIKGNVTVIR